MYFSFISYKGIIIILVVVHAQKPPFYHCIGSSILFFCFNCLSIFKGGKMKAGISLRTMALLGMIFTWGTILCPPLFASQNVKPNNADNPIILDYCNDGTEVRYGTANPAWPGHIITIPVLIKNPADSLVDLQLYGIVSNSNFVYSGFDTTNTPWPNATVTPTMLDQDSNSFEIYVHSNGYNLPISSELRRVFDVKLRIEPGESFNVTCYLRFGQRVDVDRYGPGQCQPDTTDGTIVIPEDTTRISLDWTTAYSYQASDDEATKQSFPLKIPVHLYTNYPCSTYCLPFIAPTGTKVVGFDSLGGGARWAQQIYPPDRAMTIYGCPDSEPENNTTFYLGDMLLKVDNYRTSYLDTLFTNFWNGFSPYFYKCYPWKANYSIPFANVVRDTAEIVLPPYRVTFSAKRTEVTSSDSAFVPITINPTFYAADYDLFIEHDTSYLSYNTVTSGGGTMPGLQGIYQDDSDEDSLRLIYKYHSQDHFQTGKYELPDSEQTLFNIGFKVKEALHGGDSTKISFTTNSSYNPSVWDWFSPDVAGSKIVRDKGDSSYFVTQDAWVYKQTNYVLGASATYIPGPKTDSTLDVSVTIDTINFVGDTMARLLISIGDIHIDSVTAGSFALDSAFVEQDEMGQSPSIYLYPQSTISETGTLCHIWFYSEESGEFKLKVVEGGLTSGINYHSGTCWAVISREVRISYGYPKKEVGLLPLANSLGQNYPNPFNSATNIEFYVAKPGVVTLEIFDVLGRKVKTLAHEEMIAGQHSLIWDGTDGQKHGVSGGIYFYIIKTADFQDSKRMIYLK
jgi:hypothetical protein